MPPNESAHSLPDQATGGTYSWRVVASPAIVTAILPDGRRVIAAPSAADKYHRIAKVWTDCAVGSVGELRYVSNFPNWGRLEFEPGTGYEADDDSGLSGETDATR